MADDALGKRLRWSINKELAAHTSPRLKMPPAPMPFTKTEDNAWFKRGKYEGKRFAREKTGQSLFESVMIFVTEKRDSVLPELLKTKASEKFQLIFLNGVEEDPWRFSRFYYEQKEEAFCKGFIEGYQWKIQKKKHYLR